MGNLWKSIWNKRVVGKMDIDSLLTNGSEFEIYKQLKKLDGFDVSVENENGYYENFYNSAVGTWEKLKIENNIHSAYEVGCGSGANLILMKKRGIDVGGIDYSEQMVNIASKILGGGITTGEAVDMNMNEKFDLVLSDSVFAYFPNEAYGRNVLEKMYEKSNKVIAILEVFDKQLESDCNKHRREMIEDYDRKYEGLDKIFYPREMFVNFANDNKCRIEFTKVENDFYWNSKYLYNCFIYKA